MLEREPLHTGDRNAISCPWNQAWPTDDGGCCGHRYVEKPLLPMGRKMDIRQWVLVTDWQPLTVWFYRDCYIRFAAEDYELEDLDNLFMHLTNNSVAKHSDSFQSGQVGVCFGCALEGVVVTLTLPWFTFSLDHPH